MPTNKQIDNLRQAVITARHRNSETVHYDGQPIPLEMAEHILLQAGAKPLPETITEDDSRATYSLADVMRETLTIQDQSLNE